MKYLQELEMMMIVFQIHRLFLIESCNKASSRKTEKSVEKITAFFKIIEFNVIT